MSRGRLIHVLSALALGLALILAGCGASNSGTGTTQGTPNAPNLRHIFVLVMENHSYSEIVGNTTDAPYTNQLAQKYGVASQYFGVTHPSLPNYLALMSGDTQGIWDDCADGAYITCAPQEFQASSGYTNGQQLLTPAQEASATAQPHLFTTQNIVDQLTAKGLTWKAYMENMPGVAYTGDQYADQLYRAKHNPFVYFKDIVSDPNRFSKIVPYTQLATDLQSNSVPNYVFIAPNQCHDMHGLSPSNARAENIPDCGYPSSGLDHKIIGIGDTYLSQVVPQIMGSKAWSEGAAIAIVWDEDDYAGYAGCCHSPTGVNGVVLGGANAPAIIISSKVTSHIQDDTTQYNHYSLLATIEKIWNLNCLANACGFSDNQLMTKFFN
jgi:phosphatidylinositol-3-phosphatase